MKIPPNCPPRLAELYLTMLRLRYRMTPYFFSYAVRAHLTGAPIVRPLVYQHRTDPRTDDIDDQVYVGDWIIAAPVIQRGARFRNVYLPEGDWIDYWTDAPIKGPCTLRVETPLYEMQGLPYFVRAGAILPMQDPTLRLDNTTPAHLTLDIYPSQDSTFELWDAPDACSRFRCRSDKAVVHFDIQQAAAVRRPLTLRFHGLEKSQTIVVQGENRTDPTWETQGSRPVAVCRVTAES